VPRVSGDPASASADLPWEMIKVFAQRMMSAEVEELRGAVCEEGQPGPGELRNGYRARRCARGWRARGAGPGSRREGRPCRGRLGRAGTPRAATHRTRPAPEIAQQHPATFRLPGRADGISSTDSPRSQVCAGRRGISPGPRSRLADRRVPAGIHLVRGCRTGPPPVAGGRHRSRVEQHDLGPGPAGSLAGSGAGVLPDGARGRDRSGGCADGRMAAFPRSGRAAPACRPGPGGTSPNRS
jgi:hypothetical protein